MILDHLSRAEKYHHVHTSFKRAFDYLKQHDVASMKDGTVEIDGRDIFLLLSRGTPSDPRPKLESHRKYIDIQIALDGSFPLAWRNADACSAADGPYDTEKDVVRYGDRPEFEVELTRGMFAVVFPEDAHAGLPPKERVTKAVIKVAV